MTDISVDVSIKSGKLLFKVGIQTPEFGMLYDTHDICLLELGEAIDEARVNAAKTIRVDNT